MNPIHSPTLFLGFFTLFVTEGPVCLSFNKFLDYFLHYSSPKDLFVWASINFVIYQIFTVKNSYPPVITQKRDDRLLSAVRDPLFNAFAANVRTWRPYSLSEIWGRAMSRCQRPFNTQLTIYYIENTRLVLWLKYSVQHPINLWTEMIVTEEWENQINNLDEKTLLLRCVYLLKLLHFK
jgi:hypothetical protein